MLPIALVNSFFRTFAPLTINTRPHTYATKHTNAHPTHLPNTPAHPNTPTSPNTQGVGCQHHYKPHAHCGTDGLQDATHAHIWGLHMDSWVCMGVVLCMILFLYDSFCV